MNLYTKLGIAGALALASCSPAANRKAMDVTFQLADATCIVLNATLSVEEIQKVCAIEHLAKPIIEQLAGAARVAGSAAKKDAGRD